MKRNKIVVILFILSISFIQTLKLHGDQASYLSALKNQQQSFTSKLQSLHSDIVDTKSKLKSESNLDAKIKLLESAIINHKSKLSGMSISMVPPLDQLKWTCANLHGTSQQQLKKMSDELQQQTNTLKNSVTNLSDKQTQQSLNNADAANKYSNKMQETLHTQVNYKQSSKITTGWISNLSGNRWTVGGLSLDELNNKIHKQTIKYDIVKTCPCDAPFYNGHTCVNCPQDQYFDLQNNICVTCDSFDVVTKKCTTAKTYSGSNIQAAKNRIILPDGVSLSDINKNQQNSCPKQTPFLSNGQCIDCKSPNSLFDYQKSECTSCPNGQIYQPIKMKCLSHDYFGTNYGTVKDRLILPENTTLAQLQQQQQQIGNNGNLELCPTEKPFYNNKECIDCSQNTYFNTGTYQCESCPAGLSYESSVHKCVKKTLYSNTANMNWTSTNPTKTKLQIDNSQNSKYSEACPIQTPFYNGNKCIACPSNQYFSFDTLTCSGCAQETVFSPNLHQCLHLQGAFQTNPMKAPNLIYEGISKSQWSTKYYQNIDQNPNIADCPTDRPYFDQVSCIKCPDTNPYFNLKYKLCQKCKEGSKYDPDVHECLSQSGNIIDQTPTFQKMAAGVFI